MNEKRFRKANPLVNRINNYATMSVIFRIPAEPNLDLTSTSQSGNIDGEGKIEPAILLPSQPRPFTTLDEHNDLADQGGFPIFTGQKEKKHRFSAAVSSAYATIQPKMEGELPAMPTAVPQQSDIKNTVESPQNWQRLEKIVQQHKGKIGEANNEGNSQQESKPISYSAESPSAKIEDQISYIETDTDFPNLAEEAGIPPASAEEELPATTQFAQTVKPHSIETTDPVKQELPAPADRNWRRLEHIMRLHNEKQAHEEESAPDAPPETDEPQLKVKPALVQKKTDGTSKTESLAEELERHRPLSAEAFPSESQSLPSARDIEEAATTSTSPKQTEQSFPQKQEPTASKPANARQFTNTSINSAADAEWPEAQSNEGVDESNTPGDAATVNQPDINLKDDLSFEPPIPQRQHLPLQAAWPVDTIQATAESDQSNANVLPADVVSNDIDQLQARLMKVQPGRKTDSSVPLMQPSRPRPPRPVTPVFTPLPEDRDDKAAMHDTKVANRVVPEVQRDSVEKGAPSIPTDIGTLPADLWELIGEQPPQSENFFTDQQSPALSTENVNIHSASNIRQPDTVVDTLESVVHTAVPSTDPPSDSSEEEGEQPEEADVDELARQVYAEIKRRLMIEWERTRGKFPHNHIG